MSSDNTRGLFEIFLLRAKRMAALCIRHVLQSLFFLPVKDNRVLLRTYSGEYCCNPKYVSEYLLENSKNELEIIWGFFKPKKFGRIPSIKAVKINSPAWFYYTVTSSVVITNAGFSQSQPKRKGQLLINTWHGGGAYKRIGEGVLFSQSALEHRVMCEDTRKIDLFISSSRAFTEYAVHQDLRYGGEVLSCGMPRNDLFFDSKKREEAAKCVRDALGLTNEYVVLYAPTFRGRQSKGYHTRSRFPYRDVISAVRKRFGPTSVILKRAHPGATMEDGSEENVADVTDYPDMQQLLCASDMLVTDYSSSIWDFALTGRPCLLWVPDLEDFTSTRGVCTHPEQWSGVVCRNEDELICAISSVDERACAEKAAYHLNTLGSFETGHASEQVCGRIFEHICRKRNANE